MRASRWYKRYSDTRTVEAHVGAYRTDLRGPLGVKLTFATKGIDNPEWLDVEMTRDEARDVANRILEAVG